ncbi:MAG: class I SAM-dependent RNA methyltransferase [Spartobacteria bacterium]|nr:class I SAM-dependent RNA methyltransferase [Spartobacteria bacterium]
MTFAYQENNTFFAQVSTGLEEPAATELNALGAENVHVGFRGVYFEGTVDVVCRVNYQARLVTRVLAPLLVFTCHSPKYLYKRAREIPWSDLFDVSDTFAIYANVSNSRIRHSGYAALCLKDAVVDCFRDECGERPNVDTDNPDVCFNLHIQGDKATISLDVSGQSLHRRGYRTLGVEAPMQETLAAAIIQFSGWDGARPLYDPMCGSGTLLAEAYMKYCQVPAGYLSQAKGFCFLPEFDPVAWEAMKAQADALIRPMPPGLIAGSDIDAKAIEASRQNISRLPGGDAVEVVRKDYCAMASLKDVVIVCNPPYGIRLKQDNLHAFYKEFGDFLKQRCTGSEAYIYFGERPMLKALGLKPSHKIPMVNGGLDGCLARYELY